jgi:DNA-binding PadR family transcriptional regulator
MILSLCARPPTSPAYLRRFSSSEDKNGAPQPGHDAGAADRGGSIGGGVLVELEIAVTADHRCTGASSRADATGPAYDGQSRLRNRRHGWDVTAPSLSAGDWAVLGAVGEAPTHGFAVARLLAEDAPLGRVWTMRRQDVYQALKKLVKLDLIREQTTEPGDRGPKRTIVAITPAGERLLRRWLSEPVDHVRDVRSLLLLKLLLLDRAGLDPAPLLHAQRVKLTSLLEGLEGLRANTEGFDRVLADWRVTSCRATLQFIDDLRPDLITRQQPP